MEKERVRILEKGKKMKERARGRLTWNDVFDFRWPFFRWRHHVAVPVDSRWYHFLPHCNWNWMSFEMKSVLFRYVLSVPGRSHQKPCDRVFLA